MDSSTAETRTAAENIALGFIDEIRNCDNFGEELADEINDLRSPQLNPALLTQAELVEMHTALTDEIVHRHTT